MRQQQIQQRLQPQRPQKPPVSYTHLGCDLMFEAAVAGGIPIIRPLKQCLAANHLTEVMGIVNGTTNYILTKMTKDHMERCV